MIQTHGHGILKSSFASFCLIVRVDSISRMLVVLQKTDNVRFEMQFLWDAIFVSCHFCDVPFMLGAIFVMWYFWEEECPFYNFVSMSAINVRWLELFWPSTSDIYVRHVRYFRFDILLGASVRHLLGHRMFSGSVICRTCLGRRPLKDYV